MLPSRAFPRGRLSVFIAVLVRCASVVALALVLTWVLQVEGGLGFANDGSNTFGWHALLFTIAFPVLMTELLLAFRTPSPTDKLMRNSKTRSRCALVWHLSLVAAVLVLASLAITAIVYYKRDSTAASSTPDMVMYPMFTLYSTHSWMGLFTLALLFIQFFLGLSKSLIMRQGSELRNVAGAVHSFLGKATWVAGLATCASGLQDMQGSDLASISYGPYSVDSLLAPSLALVLMLQALLVFAAISLASRYGKHRGMAVGMTRE